MKKTYNFKLRATAFIVVILFIISIFIADLFRIQVLLKDEYAQKKLYLSSASSTVDAVRGEILDCNGKVLVYNVSSNSVYIDGSYFPSNRKKQEQNEILLALVKLFESKEIEYKCDLPIEKVDGKFSYKENSEGSKKFLFDKGYLNLNKYATAENCFDALCEYHEIENMSEDEALKVCGILFNMRLEDFSKSNPFTVANNVPDDIVSIIKEQSRFYRGVDIRVDTKREYTDGSIAPHIIGFYDYINADEYKMKNDEYKETIKDESLTDEEKESIKLKAYGMQDKIGKFGIESALESELRGTKGIATTRTKSDGTKTTEITRKPQNGNNVILTIDGDFQKQVQNILDKRIESTKDKENVAAAGSIVVFDVNDFSVLACASYPTFNLSTYKENIEELNKDKSAPLWNRPLRSAYAPGSTLKPAVAMAGLEEGVITPDTQVKCNILYTYFKDRVFRCLNVGNHAGSNLTVRSAIRYSCNTFFYETGRLLGIEKMGNYLRKFGLGSKTGVELSEATGVVAGPEERRQHGGIWYPGDTVQAAIGQSDHLYTPIQLCAYASTLANGGTRYKAHFVKSIESADYTEKISETEPQVIEKLQFKDSSRNAVRNGMMDMAKTSIAFQELPFEVAAKTGTAQAKRKQNGQIVEFTNGFMISYAPAINPQIAVVIAIENVSSAGMSTYVKEVYDAYFNRNTEVSPSQQGNVILK